VTPFVNGSFSPGFQVYFQNDSTAGVDPSPFRLGFASNPASPLMNGTNPGSVDVTALQLQNGFAEEYQRLQVTATAGTFVLQLSGARSVAIPFNADAATIQNAIEG